MPLLMPFGGSSLLVRARISLVTLFLLNFLSDQLGIDILQALSGAIIALIFSLACVLSLMPDPLDFQEKFRVALLLLVVPLSVVPLSILGLFVGVTQVFSYDLIPGIVCILSIAILPFSEKGTTSYGLLLKKTLVSMPKPYSLGNKNIMIVSVIIFILAVISMIQSEKFEPDQTSLSILEKESMNFPQTEYNSEGVDLVFSVSSNKELTYELSFLVFHNGDLVLSDTKEMSSDPSEKVVYEIPVDFSDPGEWMVEGSIESADQERQVFHNFIVKE